MKQRALTLQWLGAAYRHKTLLASIFLVVMGATGAYVAFAPRKYESTMQIVVQDAREKPLEDADKETGAPNQATTQELIESRVNSEMELLSASDIMERAVAYRAKTMGEAPPDPGSRDMAKLVEKLDSRLKLTPVRKTSILEVSYRDEDPRLAQKVLAEIQAAYLDKHLRVLRPEGTAQLFAIRANETNQQLMATQQQLVAFQLANHVVSIPAETEELTKQLNDLSEGIAAEQTAQAAAEAQRKSLNRLMDSGGPGGAAPKVPERVLSSSKSSTNFYATQQINAQLVELKNRRLQLLTRFVPTDPLVVEVDQQIASTVAEMSQLKQDPNVEQDTDINPVWNQLQQQLRTTEVAAAGSTARLASLREQEAAVQARLTQLKSIGIENDRLDRQLGELRETEQLYAQKSEHERLEDVLDRDKVGNIAVAMEPTYSMYPVSPKILLTLVLGFITAIFLCVSILVLLEANRVTVLTAAELEEFSGLEVLSSVPDLEEMYKK